MFCLLSLQDAVKSPEVKKKIQHVTWPWTMNCLCTDLMGARALEDKLLPSYQKLLPTACALPIIVPLTESQKGMKTLFTCVSRPPHSSLSALRADWMGWCSKDLPAFEVASFLVAFHNLKCPYHQWSATLLQRHRRRPTGKTAALLLFFWNNL